MIFRDDMKSTIPLDLEVYPPFDGFPKEGLRFLKLLRKNNNRTWFNAHKAEYEDYVKLPMQSLIVALRPHVQAFAPEIDFNPKRSMFRIYRDTRFSKDKTPYKTHVAAVFRPRGHWQDSAGYYVHVEPDITYVGGGIYMPDGDQLKKIRRAIDEQSEEFLSIVGTQKFKKQFNGIEGERLQRVPQGYAADHPMGEWLKHKQFYTGVDWKEPKYLSPKFVNDVAKVYKELYPFIRFLNSALGK
jgi:uncharacterized protein (TIGR02453 family)